MDRLKIVLPETVLPALVPSCLIPEMEEGSFSESAVANGLLPEIVRLLTVLPVMVLGPLPLRVLIPTMTPFESLVVALARPDIVFPDTVRRPPSLKIP